MVYFKEVLEVSTFFENSFALLFFFLIHFNIFCILSEAAKINIAINGITREPVLT